MEALYEFGIRLVQAVQNFSPALDGLMKFFSFLGTIEFYILIVPLFYWAFSASLGMRLLLVLLITDVFGSLLKQLFHQPRPYWLGGVKVLAEESSYGVPSTHASNSLALWVYLAWKEKRGWLWGLATLLILVIGWSRLYLGVHFPHDVVVGWLLGSVVVYAFTRLEARFSTWARESSSTTLLLVGLAGSASILLLGWLVLAAIAGSPDPERWRSFATLARQPDHYFTLSGFLFGSVSGYVLMTRQIPFKPATGWRMRGASYLLGIAILLLIYLGLDAAFALLAADDTPLGYTLRFIRYSTVAFWATYLAPWVFIKLKWVNKTGSLNQ